MGLVTQVATDLPPSRAVEGAIALTKSAEIQTACLLQPPRPIFPEITSQSAPVPQRPQLFPQ
jgi:hypothetical protein